MERNVLIIIIFAFALSIVTFTIILILGSNIVIEEKEVFAKLIIGETTGFDTNSSVLAFGKITKDTSATRTVKLENNNDFKIKIEIIVEGNISEFVSDNLIDLGPYENKSVDIAAVGHENATLGNYSGIVKFVFKRDLFGK